MSKNICEHCCVNEDIPEETVARANEIKEEIAELERDKSRVMAHCGLL